MEPKHPHLAAFVRSHAVRFGTFTLASGRTSDRYFDGKAVSFSGPGLMLLVEAMLAELEQIECDAIGGMDMGATPIVSAVALRAAQLGRDLPAFIVRKEAKQHGTQRRTEGLLPEKPSRLVMIDDVITTGGSIGKAIDVVQGMGHEVVATMCILDREAGGDEAFRQRGIRFVPLVRLSELDLPAETRLV